MRPFKLVALLFATLSCGSSVNGANQIDSVHRTTQVSIDSIKSIRFDRFDAYKTKKLSSHIRFLTTVPQMKSLKVTRIPQYTYRSGDSRSYYSNPAMNYISTQRSFNAYRSYKW